MADAVGAILLASVTLYAVFGGADFGAGLWDLLAGTTARGRAPRNLIDESITPVWEANHVWLVFDLVIFWTAFPRAFASVMTALALPTWLAVAGIVLRGAVFAFRKEITRLSQQRAAGAAFAFSSLLTPFFMGTVVGAIATGAVPANATHASLAAWTSPTALLSGFVFVAACGYLAAVYLVVEAGRRDDRPMRTYFTRRAEGAAVAAGALSLAALFEVRNPDPVLFDRLAGRTKGIRIIAALGVAAVIWGWGVAQYPVLLPGTAVTLTDAGATQATFVALVVVAVAAVILVVPSFALLFSLQGRRMLGGSEHGTPPAADSRRDTGLPSAAHAGPPSPGQRPGSATRVVALGLVAIAAIARRRRPR